MKAATFVSVILFSGVIAGTVLGGLNQLLLEPYIETAIQLENLGAEHSGQIINPFEFSAYRSWQRAGEIAAGSILGISLGSLVGIVFAYTRASIPGSNNKKKALIVSCIMWVALFLVPALKYPANPPGVGDPETIYYRQALYVAFLAISGFSSLALAILYRKFGHWDGRKVIVPAIYSAVIVVAYIVMPPNPDKLTAPMDLVIGFRITSMFTMSVFWGLLGVTLGIFWDKLWPVKNPDSARLRHRN